MPPPERGELDALRDAKPAFEKAWDQWDTDRDDASAPGALPRGAGRLGGGGPPEGARLERLSTSLRLTADVRGPLARLLGHRHPDRRAGARGHRPGRWSSSSIPSTRCGTRLSDGWAASPVDRMEMLLRTCGVPIGVVTDGRWWAIVSARPETMVASGIVDAQTWIEEPATRNAFIQLLRLPRLIGRRPEDLLTELFGQSVAAAEEITEALGTQVRRAVELLVQAMSEAAIDARRRGEPDPLPADRDEVYQAAVTVMMRVVFLLFAEERGLLPQGRLFTAGYGISDELDTLDARAREEGSEALDATHLTWHRLLATSQALYRGASFEDIRLPSYGGSLFDPARFAFLTARDPHGTLAVTVSDRVMLEVLKAVQMAKLRGEPARRISFRDIDVEQIGYIYEGLLGYSCQDVEEITVGLIGKEGEEPEIPLARLEDARRGDTTDGRPPSPTRSSPGSKTTSPPPRRRPRPRSPGPSATAARSRTPTARCARWRPPTRSCGTGSGRSSGSSAATCATGPRSWCPAACWSSRRRPARPRARTTRPSRSPPKSCSTRSNPSSTIPVPHQRQDGWVPVDSDRILELKVADIACGSGAFLVAAARYLAGRLVEAWQREEAVTGMTPRELETHAIRTVIATCLYGADINAMAVEMCKLSLWLVSLDPKLPFSFVDDKILHGNSLLGLTDVRQLKRQHIDPDAANAQQSLYEADVDGVLRQARRLRRQLASEVNDNDPQRSTNTKRRQWHRYQEITAQLTEVADAVIATGLKLGGKPGRALNVAYENLGIALGNAYPTDGSEPSRGHARRHPQGGPHPHGHHRLRALEAAALDPRRPRRDGPRRLRRHHRQPPVPRRPEAHRRHGHQHARLARQRPGGRQEGQRRPGRLLLPARDVAAELRRATSASSPPTPSPRATPGRSGSTKWSENGFTITRAIQSRSWPAASANLEYAAVWGTRGEVAASVPRVADDIPVERISTLLEPGERRRSSPAC